jgi:heterotetrameric sarcosine oxidase delta subunit
MLIIHCPHCGARDHTEFSYGGDAKPRRPAGDAPVEAWSDFVYLRDNPRGSHEELWQHVQGCRAWLIVRRDTLTHAITDTRLPDVAQERP